MSACPVPDGRPGLRMLALAAVLLSGCSTSDVPKELGGLPADAPQRPAQLPAYPGVFPAPHPSGGHPLFVSKEVIEMVAMLALAALPVGRWCGLDFIIHYGLVRPIFGRRKSHASDA